MRQLEICEAVVMAVAIRQEIYCKVELRYHYRLHGVLLVANSMSTRQAAQWHNENVQTVQRLVNRVKVIGFTRLQEGERPGWPGCLSAGQSHRLPLIKLALLTFTWVEEHRD